MWLERPPRPLERGGRKSSCLASCPATHFVVEHLPPYRRRCRTGKGQVSRQAIDPLGSSRPCCWRHRNGNASSYSDRTSADTPNKVGRRCCRCGPGGLQSLPLQPVTVATSGMTVHRLTSLIVWYGQELKEPRCSLALTDQTSRGGDLQKCSPLSDPDGLST
jgi:hypothetical protein